MATIFRPPIVARIPRPSSQVAVDAQTSVWQPCVLLLAAVAVPFHQTEWPNPQPAPTHVYERRISTGPTLPLLTGQDTFYGAPGQRPTYQPPPNPRGPEFPVALRTWLQSERPEVLSVPFVQTEWPNPRGPAYPASLWANLDVDPSEVWFLQDTFFGGAGQPPSYQPPPNPLGPVYPVSLRTWTQDHLRDTLAPTGIPFDQTDWPNPRGPAFPVSLRTTSDVVPSAIWLLRDTFYGGAGQPPTYQPPPNPLGPTYPVALRTWTQDHVRDILAPVAAPFAVTDWPNPRGPAYPTATWTQDHLRDTLAPAPAPFAVTDWPNPRGPAYPISLRSNIDQDPSETWLLQDTFYGGPGQPPTYQPPPNPLGPVYPVALRTWLQDHVRDTLAPPGAAAFVVTDWPNPRGAAYPLALLTWSQDHIRDTLASSGGGGGGGSATLDTISAQLADVLTLLRFIAMKGA